MSFDPIFFYLIKNKFKAFTLFLITHSNEFKNFINIMI
jgi:hypothetical protein